MNNLPFIIYLINVCENLHSLFCGIAVVGGIALFMCGMPYLLADGDLNESTMRKCKVGLIIGAIGLCVGVIVHTFIPTKDVLYTYLGVQTVEYISNNDTITGEAKDLYNDVKTIIHNYAASNDINME